MKKRHFMMILMMLGIMISASSQSIRGETGITRDLRIGLEYKYKEVDSVPITNTQVMMGYETKGEWIPEAIFESTAGFSVAVDSNPYLRIEELYSSYQNAKATGDILRQLGVLAYPASVDSQLWMVYIKGQENAEAILTTVKAILPNASISSIQGSNRRMEIKSGAETIGILDHQNLYPQFAPLDSSQTAGVITLGDRTYRGKVEIGRYGGNKLTAVNVLSIEEYLYGVVPSEMPASWPMEALKAQAVAARSYTMTRFDTHKNQGYDLCDGVHCQAYKGYGNEHPNTNQAVAATAGQMIYYDSKLVGAVYFSSSGGYTESSEHVWVAALPYFTAVPDPYDTPKIWSRTYTLEDFQKALAQNKVDIGTVTDVKATSYTSAGRVLEMKIIGTKGEHKLQKESVRSFFSAMGGSLDSRMFQIVAGGSTSSVAAVGAAGTIVSNQDLSKLSVVGANGRSSVGALSAEQMVVQGQGGIKAYSLVQGQDGAYVFQGRGWGHGVGMSQYGAKGFAEQGYTYQQILTYYYTGTTIR